MDLSNLPISEFQSTNVNLQDKVSENFTFREILRSDVATRQGIENKFASVQHVQNAVFLVRTVLQPLRSMFGPYTPNSVYRCQAVERALKNKPVTWVSGSQHTIGCAADIEIPTLTNYALADLISRTFEFDQVILEMYVEGEPHSGWVHVSTVPDPSKRRKQVLSYVKRKGSWIYVSGLTV